MYIYILLALDWRQLDGAVESALIALISLRLTYRSYIL